MMTVESPELFQAQRLSESAVSHLSDNVVLLSYVQEHNSINRAITVIKSRASHHQSTICPFTIGPHGITLARNSRSPGKPASEPPNHKGAARRTSGPKT
jgi:circadian clock protein KaiC